MSEQYTKGEVRDQILQYIKDTERYWAGLPGMTTQEKLSGLSFSILSMIDGVAMGLPSMDIVLRPHLDDKSFNKAEGRDYYEDGMVVNDDIYLHECYPGSVDKATN